MIGTPKKGSKVSVKSSIIKTLLEVIFFFGAITCLTHCSGSDSENADPASSSAYYIELGDDRVECDDLKDVSYISDGVADVTTFEIGSGLLEINGFHADFEVDPMNVEGKTYNGAIAFSNTIEGEISISKVHEGEERSIGFDHKMEGTFKGDDGSTGAFAVNVMFIP